MTRNVIKAKILALQQELKALEQQEREEREKRQKEFKRQWQFTLTPVALSSCFDRPMAPGVRQVQLNGELVNQEEATALGIHDPKGSMCYWYHDDIGLIAQVGGGSLFLPRDDDADTKRVISELNSFLKQHPNGGDVTVIVLSSKKFAW